MKNTTHYTHGSRIGTFHIYLANDGWRTQWNDECLDRKQRTAQHALDNLAGGHCDWPGTTDPETLGLPDEIGEWAQYR